MLQEIIDIICEFVETDPEEITESTTSESLDRLSLQLAIVMGIYLVTYLLTLGLTKGLGAISAGAENAVGSLLWGFNFMVGSALAIATRAIFRKRFDARSKHYKKQDNYLLSRISGLAFDAMIVAGIGSIEPEELAGLWVPFLLMAVAGAIVTFLHSLSTMSRNAELLLIQSPPNSLLMPLVLT